MLLPFALTLCADPKPTPISDSALPFDPASQTTRRPAGHDLPVTMSDVGGSPNETDISGRLW